MRSPATRSGRSTVYAPRAAVATSQPLATSAGLGVLRDGGNAVDAAVAAAAVLSVTEPYMTGPGGDAFALVWSAAEGRLVGLDASGRAGSGADPDALRSEGFEAVPPFDPRAVTVPGAVAGWQAMLDRWGTRELGELLRPAIRLAEEGFPVSPVIARDWAAAEEGLAADPGAAATFLAGGRAPRAGEWHRNPDLAATLRSLAREGPSVLYGGALGARVVEHLQARGGFLEPEDLRAHECRWVEPLSIEYGGDGGDGGWRLHELPPAGQGIAALQMLGMLRELDLGSLAPGSVDWLHTLVEVKKLAYADLDRHVADADHMEVPPERLLDRDYLRARLEGLDPRRAAERPEPGAFATASETVYLAAADPDGNMVSFIQSIYRHFGARIVVPGTGFALQNRGAGFTLEEGHPNRLGPGKRPFHTLVPGFATRDGEPWMAFGVMGGAMQAQGHVQVLLGLVEQGLDLQEALEAPRFRHLDGLRVSVEELPAEVAQGLEARGHVLVPPAEAGGFGGAQAVVRLGRGWAAASDPRKDGMAAGL